MIDNRQFELNKIITELVNEFALRHIYEYTSLSDDEKKNVNMTVVKNIEKVLNLKLGEEV